MRATWVVVSHTMYSSSFFRHRLLKTLRCVDCQLSRFSYRNQNDSCATCQVTSLVDTVNGMEDDGVFCSQNNKQKSPLPSKASIKVLQTKPKIKKKQQEERATVPGLAENGLPPL